jgi:hypothetical protein
MSSSAITGPGFVTNEVRDAGLGANQQKGNRV